MQQRSLTITASNRVKTYGDALAFAGTEFATAGLANDDSVTSVALASAGAAATAGVGPYDIVASLATGNGLSNYAIGYAKGTLTVQHRTLTITASDRTKTYGDAVTFAGTEFATAGLANDDAVTGIALASAGAGAGAGVGAYPIVPSQATGSGLSNYAIGYVDGSLNVQPKTAFAASTFGGGGAASASFTGGGPNCTFDPSATAFVAPSFRQPADAPHGMFQFRLIGCDVGSTVRMSVTWPSLAGFSYMKYGPANAYAKDLSVFYIPRNLAVRGLTASFDVTDGQVGDDDLAANGVIVDPSGPVRLPDVAVPTLDEWMLALLGLLLATLAAISLRGARRGRAGR